MRRQLGTFTYPISCLYVFSDRYVLMGNHRDAWMNGATDAVSGTTTMMETSRVFAELMKTGIITYCPKHICFS